jgi:PAS domain S-box-containing protein
MSKEDLLLLSRIPNENPNPILRIGFNGTLLWANDAFYKLDCFKDERVGQPVSQSLNGPVMEVVESLLSMDTEIFDGDKVFLFNLVPVPDIENVFLYGRDITIRRNAEKELRQMALIARETDNAVVITDPDGCVQWINQGFEKLTGYSFHEVNGKIPGQLLQGPDTDPQAIINLSEALKNQHSIEQDVINYTKSGIPYWVHLQIQPVFDPTGKLVNFISIQKNVSSEKLLQQEIKDSEQRLRMILESALDGVIIIDDQSLVLTWTRQSEVIFGWTAEEVIGKPLGNFIVPERMRDQHLAGMKRYLSTGIPRILNQRIEITGKNKSGAELSIELTITPIKKDDKLVFSAFIRDISKAKEALNNLKSMTSRLSALISTLNSGILVEDENRNIALINQLFCDMFGIPVNPEFLIGTDCTNSAEQSKNLFENPEQFINRIDELLSIREISLNEEIMLADGRFFERDYIPVISGGTFLGNLWQYKDITQRKKNDKILEQSKIAAEEANRAKSSFLANMSHEIRTPMNAIHGIIRLLSEAPQLPEQADLHQRLLDSSESMLAIINDILDFSKIEAGLMSLETTPFGLAQIFKRLSGPMDVKARQKSLTLIHSIDERIAPVLKGDPTRLNQVLLNLVNNSIKFTEKGSITLSAKLVSSSESGNTIEFSVADTGIGIDKDRLDIIFQSFEQESVSTTRQFGGTGLGLSISRQLVELMGGELKVESKKYLGSRFYFSLNLETDSASSISSSDKKVVIDFEKLRGRKVLIVEDNEMNQFVAKSILKMWNMDIYQARNGQKAIVLLTEQTYDIILMDKQMPVMDGVESTRYIREVLKSDIPIIALTADAQLEKVQECLAAGMNDYITKPFEPEILFSKIVKLLKI